MQAAQRLAPGKVRPALSLVGYAEDVAKAIAYVFSDTLICDDAESAKRVTFNRDVGVRSVTLEGDVYDPSGTLSGGSAPSGSGVLIQVQEFLEAESRLGQARKKLEVLEQEEEKSRRHREEWKALTRDLEMKEHELKLLEDQVEGSNAARVSRWILLVIPSRANVSLRLGCKLKTSRRALVTSGLRSKLLETNRRRRTRNARSLNVTWLSSRTIRKARSTNSK